MRLLARPVGSKHTHLVGTSTTADDGTVSFTDTPRRSTVYRLRLMRSTDLPGALSDRTRVWVRTPTSLSIRGKQTGTDFAVSGVLRGGGHALAHRTVTLLEQAPGSATWTAGRHRPDQPPRPCPVPRAAGARHRLPSRLCGWPPVRAEQQRDRRLLIPAPHTRRERRWTPRIPTTLPVGPAPQETRPAGGSLPGPPPDRTRARNAARISTTPSTSPAAVTSPASRCCGGPCTLRCCAT